MLIFAAAGLSRDELLMAAAGTTMRRPKELQQNEQKTNGSQTADTLRLLEFAYRMGQGASPGQVSGAMPSPSPVSVASTPRQALAH